MIQPQESHAYLQIIKHISHVAAVVQGISIGAFSFGNLALALENISKVTPCCQEEKTVFRKSCNPITRQSIQVSGSSSGRQTPQRNYFYGRGGWLVFSSQFSGSLHLTVRLTFHSGDLHTFCIHIAFGWEKGL